MKSANIYDFLVVAAYFLFMVGIGVYFMRVSKGGKDYFAGGNMLPWWVAGMSLYMTNFSAWIFTGGAGMAYKVGWYSLFYFGIGGFAYWIGTFLTAARWRRTRTISPVEYTYTRFNVTTQQLLGWVIAINFTLSAGVQLASTSKLFSPFFGLDITVVVLITGLVILLYSFMGGLWAVTVTDTLQGVILLSVAFIIVPASLYVVGGFHTLVETLPPLSFHHVINNVVYDEHWLVSILLISSIGFASGGAQRFFSVKDEKDARRVGWFAGALALTGPLIFGIPPLVARVMWPDLSQVEFFKPYAGSNPQDLVYVGLTLHLLPNGLIGVFLAAMLAATMSALSSVYNMVSSIISRDMYQGLLRPDTTDEQLLKVGRYSTLVIGLIVTGLAAVFVNSQFGIFNLMVAFFTLFNVPVVIPTAFGLIFRRVPKWSAGAAIIWGLIVGVTTRYVLGWTIGMQVYLAFFLTFTIFASSYWVGRLYIRSKTTVGLVSLILAGVLGWLFSATADPTLGSSGQWYGILSGTALGASLFWFAKLFASETQEQRKTVEEFFRKLDTPIDVAKEVFGKGRKQVSTFPIVGGTTIVMGLLMSLIFLADMPVEEELILGAIILLLVVVGAMMWHFGKKSEIRNAQQYVELDKKAAPTT